MPLAVGTRLGRYEIRALLGAGGMGEVYLAWDADLEREVAVKVLREGRDESPERMRRFVQEAKAASALNHPNVAQVYDIGSENALRFIAMEVVEGRTLRQRIHDGQLPLDEVLSVGTQIAAGLAAAHAAGIVHRDIKPDNVIVRPDGYVKILDFGLAKLTRPRDPDAETLLLTGSGVVMGTLHYMAPEQFGSSGDVTAAADVFSTGVVLYELLTGHRPFEGRNATEVASAILTKPARDIAELRAETPPRLKAIITKALQKDPGLRHATGAEMLAELNEISGPRAMPLPEPSRRRVRAGIAAAVVVVLAGSSMTLLGRSARIRKARQSLVAAEALLSKRQFADAYLAIAGVEKVLPAEPRVRALIAHTSTRATFESDPPGATVALRRYEPDAAPAKVMGTTPLTIEHLPKADYVVTFTRSGYAPMTRVLQATPFFMDDWEMPGQAPKIRVALPKASLVPADMVLVEGGPYRLNGWDRASEHEVELGDFLIDRFEVSNRQYEEFTRAGGYRRRELWQHPFVDGARTLSFEEAMTRFRDTTGLPGPRNWRGGAPPPGRENHPVTNITWYEAAAFAQWKGKVLPTMFEWDKAGKPGQASHGMTLPWGGADAGSDVSARANFGTGGTLPVDSLPFGVSGWGAYHMAGNVAEWCLNRYGAGFLIRGGSWNDAVYAFGRPGSLPGFYASGQVGFRCAKAVQSGTDQGAFPLQASVEVPVYERISDAEFAALRRRYDYPKTPLQVRVVETIDEESWRREKLEFASGKATVTAYLWTPKGFRPPYQVIHFAPAGDVLRGLRSLDASVVALIGPLMRAGRAVFSVVSVVRLADIPDSRLPEYADFVVENLTQQRRGLDVLETRKDVDTSRIAFIGPSAGAWTGVILTAVDRRYRSVMFIGTRVRPSELTDAPAANRIFFAAHITPPKLMLQGRYDEEAPLATTAEPLFRLFPEPKRLEVYEGTHMPSAEVLIPAATRWLDETLGPVAQ